MASNLADTGVLLYELYPDSHPTATCRQEGNMIRAGNLKEISRQSGQWAFVDLGFAEKARSCGLVVHDGDPVELTFSGLLDQLAGLSRQDAPRSTWSSRHRFQRRSPAQGIPPDEQSNAVERKHATGTSALGAASWSLPRISCEASKRKNRPARFGSSRVLSASNPKAPNHHTRKMYSAFDQ